MDFIYPLLFVNNNVNTRKSFILQLILLENLSKPRQLYLQPQNSVLSNLRLAA
ncbi:DNA alkylation repair protein [Streptococcus pneumoniae]|nr:DNA alkylation repair protein [Streptococcus pneumoniae]UKP75475.1 DNA alkylation repair protein [Streptococcus pneumoniae]